MHPMNKMRLRAMLLTNRRLFEETLARVPAQYIHHSFEDDIRSGKDIVAHITAWEQRLVHWLQDAAQGKAPCIPEEGATWDDMDRLNSQTLMENHDRPFSQILEASHDSFQQLLEQIELLSEEDLTNPERFAWMEGEPLWRQITSGPGYAHYQGHLFDLVQRLDPSERFVPDRKLLPRYVGTFADPDGTLIFRMVQDQLLMTPWWNTHETVCIAVDMTHFAFGGIGTEGLITFQVSAFGDVSELELWSYTYRRVEAVK